jgi:hypothetical protein
VCFSLLQDATGDKKEMEKEERPQRAMERQVQEGLSLRWTRLVKRIHKPITRSLFAIARQAVTYPKAFITGIIIFSCCIVVLGLSTNFNVSIDEDVLWTPKNSRPSQHAEWIEEDSGFPLDPRFVILNVHSNGADVLGEEGVRRVFEALDTVRQISGYDDACVDGLATDVSGNPTCRIGSVTTFWNNTYSVFEDQVDTDQDVVNVLSRFFYPDGRPVDHEEILGNPEFSDDNLLSSTQMYVTWIDLPFTDKGADVEAIAVDRILSLQEAWDAEDGNVFHLELFAARSFSDEFTRAIVTDIPLVAGKFSRTPHLFFFIMPSVAHSPCVFQAFLSSCLYLHASSFSSGTKFDRGLFLVLEPSFASCSVS